MVDAVHAVEIRKHQLPGEIYAKKFKTSDSDDMACPKPTAIKITINLNPYVLNHAVSGDFYI
jgi:hypothetical protein